jgi:predicted site-specific integrase-resolvase
MGKDAWHQLKTAWRWFKSGNLPTCVKMEQMPTGTVIVTEMAHPAMVVPGLAVGPCARVSSSDHKSLPWTGRRFFLKKCHFS